MARRFSAAMLRAGAAVLLFCGAPAGAATIHVGTTSGCDFSTIGDALDSLSDGDHNYQILVSGGTFAENLVVDGKIFTLDGGHVSCTDATPGAVTTITRDHTATASSRSAARAR